MVAAEALGMCHVTISLELITSWAWKLLTQKVQPPDDNDVVHIKKSAFEGQRDAHIDAVRTLLFCFFPDADVCSGLDNAGKTTIVKKIMGEDVNSVSPTLGFIIKTIDYEGWVKEMENPCIFADIGCKI